MAQTTTSGPLGCGKLEISVGCTGVYTDISGSSQGIDPITQDRLTGEAYTLDGLAAIVNGGKLQPFDLVATIVYTETAAEAWLLILAAWEGLTCDSRICVRWSPFGGAVGDLEYLVQGVLSSVTFPNMNASEGGTIMAGFKARAALITRNIVTS